jgi:hypothetical protein
MAEPAPITALSRFGTRPGDNPWINFKAPEVTATLV